MYKFILTGGLGFGTIRDAKCFERIFPMKTSMYKSLLATSTSIRDITSSISRYQDLRRSKSARINTSFGPHFVTAFLVEINIFDEQTMTAYLMQEDPNTYKEGIRDHKL